MSAVGREGKIVVDLRCEHISRLTTRQRRDATRRAGHSVTLSPGGPIGGDAENSVFRSCEGAARRRERAYPAARHNARQASRSSPRLCRLSGVDRAFRRPAVTGRGVSQPTRRQLSDRSAIRQREIAAKRKLTFLQTYRYGRKGSLTRTPVGLKSAMLRVTTVRS